MSEPRQPLYFRAVKHAGALLAQYSDTGHQWRGSLAGLDVIAVRTQFARLKERGCVIVDTEDYRHE